MHFCEVNNTPRYNFLFKDGDGNHFTVYLKNGSQYDWAKNHNCIFLRIN